MKSANQIRNFVVAGHGGSGKTILCEQMLFKAKAIDRCGTVEQKNTTSDFMPDEQEKQSSIYGTPLTCEWQDCRFFFADTPGYGEFVGEPLTAMRAADAALVVLDGVEGPLPGTARAWKMARARGISRFGMINRLDRDRADFRAVLAQMRRNHGKNVVIPFTCPNGQGADFTGVFNVLFGTDIPAGWEEDVAEYRATWMDAIAETDEELTMRYLDGETLTSEEIARGMKQAIREGKVIPVFAASALKDIGVTELMNAIIEIFPTPLDKGEIEFEDGTTAPVSESGPGIGLAYKTFNDPFIGQLSFVRVVSGVFRSDSEVFNLSNGQKERVGKLLFMNGKNQAPTDAAGPGCIVAMAKLKNTHTGDTVSAAAAGKLLVPVTYPTPVMSYAISAAKSGEDEKVAAGINRIAECDPTVHLMRQPETRETLLCGMGELHLGNVIRKLKNEYKAEAVIATPKVPYRETITAAGEGHYRHKKQTGGAGQFAEVHLKISPNEAGFEFVNEVVGGTIPKNFIPAVEKGVTEMLTKGPLVGCTVERVKVAVYDGKYHPVDSNEMAFKTASRMAFREAMAQAKPVLLEPIMKVRIMVPDAYMGDISGDLNHKRGRILGMSMDEGLEVINAEVPLAEMYKYATELRSMTQGRGAFEMDFNRYEPVPSTLAGEIIAKHQSEQEE